MKIEQLFDKGLFSMTVEELVLDINELLNEEAPSGKTHEDFTGGYVQQLKNSTRFTAFFGTKPGTKNKDTVQIDIEPEEMDVMYMMLKAKIHDMRNNGARVKKVSLAQRKLARKLETEKPDAKKGW